MVVPAFRHISRLVRWGTRSVVVAGLLVAGGCQSPTSPAEAPDRYDALVQRAIVQAEGRPDTSFFWLRNSGDARARSLMVELKVDYLRFDRGRNVLCLWSGEGVWPAQGFATAPESGSVARDSIGMLCDIEGQCSAEAVTEQWSRFYCE